MVPTHSKNKNIYFFWLYDLHFTARKLTRFFIKGLLAQDIERYLKPFQISNYVIKDASDKADNTPSNFDILVSATPWLHSKGGSGFQLLRHKIEYQGQRCLIFRSLCIYWKNRLAHFMPLISFCIYPIKHDRTRVFLFSWVLERDQWYETCQKYCWKNFDFVTNSFT